MAETVTGTEIATWAIGKSRDNNPAIITTEATDLYQLINRALRGLGAYAARINPTFFATSSSVAMASSKWVRPEDAESIYRVEAAATSGPTNITAGTEIIRVPFDQRATDPAFPAIYRLGQYYYPRSSSATVAPKAPQDGSLTFYYAKRFAALTVLTGTIDGLWTPAYNELLVLELAVYLALKDKRTTDLATLIPARDHWLNLFTAFLEHEDVGERRRFEHVQRFNTQTRVPIRSVLAGGG